MLKGLTGVAAYINGIIVTGTTQEELLHLILVLEISSKDILPNFNKISRINF